MAFLIIGRVSLQCKNLMTVSQRLMSLSTITTSSTPTTSFKEISTTLVTPEEIKEYNKEKRAAVLKRIEKSRTGIVKKRPIKSKIIAEVPQNPSSFDQILKTSPAFKDIVNVEDEAEKLLEKSIQLLAKKGGSDFSLQSPDVDSIMKEVEEIYPIQKADPKDLARSTLNKPTFNIARIINQNLTLQKLVDLGVSLARWEKMKKVHIALSLEFDTNVAPKIQFLVDQGIRPEELGEIFTNCPEIFQIHDDDLQIRLNYLKSKNFTNKMILDVIRNSHAKWFEHDVKDVDTRLGYFQKVFGLNGREVRTLATIEPKLIIWRGTPVQVNYNKLTIVDSMGFTQEEAKQILLTDPQVYLSKFENSLQTVFNLLHNDNGITHELLAKFPSALIGNRVTIRDRCMFLKQLGKNQYDPKLPNYVSPPGLVDTSDEEFCLKYAKVPIHVYNEFLKTV